MKDKMVPYNGTNAMEQYTAIGPDWYLTMEQIQCYHYTVIGLDWSVGAIIAYLGRMPFKTILIGIVG